MPASQARLPFLWQPQPIPSFNMLQGFLAEGPAAHLCGPGQRGDRQPATDGGPVGRAAIRRAADGAGVRRAAARRTGPGLAGDPALTLGLERRGLLDAAAAADAALGPALMLLAAQSMAVGTIMMRWVASKADPVVATGWHMILGGLPLAALALAREGGDLPARRRDT